MRNNFKVLLLFLIIAPLLLTESQRQATTVISDESEEEHPEPSMETVTRSKRTPRARERGRCRLLRRRKRCVKWCTARMKASVILNGNIFQTAPSSEFRTGSSLEKYVLSQLTNSELDLVWNSELGSVWNLYFFI